MPEPCESIVTVTSRTAGLHGLLQMMVQVNVSWAVTLGAAQVLVPSPVVWMSIFPRERPVGPKLLPVRTISPPKMEGRVDTPVTTGAS